MSCKLKDRGGAADAPLLKPGALISEKKYKGEFGNFGRLDIHRQTGDPDPVSVPAYLHAQRGADQQIKSDIEEEQ